jgi:predicted DNA-binding protein (UPF0278 family)
MTERTEREEIAQIIAYEFANGPERFVCTKAANRIFAEHIEPLRREIARVCELGERRTRERDEAMTKAEYNEARANALEALLAEICESGLIYWEPNTNRGHVAKAEMLAKAYSLLNARKGDADA